VAILSARPPLRNHAVLESTKPSAVPNASETGQSADGENGCAKSPFRDANGLSDGRRAKRSARRAVRRGGREQQACASQRTRKSSYPCRSSYPIAAQSSSEQQTRESQAACWPVTTWVAAGGGALERVELPLSLLQQPSCLFLLGTLGCNDSCSVVGREVAEFVGFGARQCCSREGVSGGTLWVDGAHSELIAACLLGS